jgi:streptogramin lyase
MVYRPSSSFSASGGYPSGFTDTQIYGSSGTIVFPDGVAGGTTAGVASGFKAAQKTAAPNLTVTQSFAVRDEYGGIDWRTSSVSAIGYIEDPTLGNSIWVGGDGITSLDPQALYSTGGYATVGNTGSFVFDHQTSPGIWFSQGSGSSSAITKIDLTTEAITTSVTPGNYPRAMCYGDDSIWVGHINDSTIKRIDPVTETVIATITLSPTSRRAGSGAIYANGSAWFSDYGSGRVFKINPSTNTSTEIYLGTDLIWGFGYDGTQLWLTSSRTDAIYTVNPSTNAVTKRTASNFLTTSNSRGFVWDGTGMWIADGAFIKKMDPATWSFVDSVAITYVAPVDFVLLDGFIYVAEQAGGLITKIDLSTSSVVDQFDVDTAKVRTGYSHIDREFTSAYSGTGPRWTKAEVNTYGAAVFAAFGPGVVPTADQWGVGQVRW